MSDPCEIFADFITSSPKWMASVFSLTPLAIVNFITCCPSINRSVDTSAQRILVERVQSRLDNWCTFFTMNFMQVVF